MTARASTASSLIVVSLGAAYVAAVYTLVLKGVYSLAEPLFMLAIFGVALPGIALVLARRCAPIRLHLEPSAREMIATLALVAWVVCYLLWGSDWIDSGIHLLVEPSPRLDVFVNLIKKLLAFVIAPYLVLSRTFGYRWRDFGFVRDWRTVFGSRYLVLAFSMFVLYAAVQYLIGRGAQPVFDGEFAIVTLIVGGTLTFALRVFEVGLVEEFFFRALLQARLAAWLNSDIAGLLLMALVFGLAHAPGLYLRGAGSMTPLGPTPDFASAVAYSVAVLALAGLAFGVIWMKTRNIYVLILIHAWVDTLSGLPHYVEIFGLE